MKYSSESSSDKFAKDIDPFRCHIFWLCCIVHSVFYIHLFNFQNQITAASGYERLSGKPSRQRDATQCWASCRQCCPIGVSVGCIYPLLYVISIRKCCSVYSRTGRWVEKHGINRAMCFCSEVAGRPNAIN